ncbi:MAG: alpha/beta fold hydrolase [Anaerolineae bacterium]
MNNLRNFIIRLSITYIVFNGLGLLPGIQYGDLLFEVWIVSLVFVVLSAVLRRVLLALTLPVTILTTGLFIFVIDGLLLLLTATVTSMEVAGLGWALLAAFVMSIINIWVEWAFIRLGWMEGKDDDDPDRIESPGWLLRILLLTGMLLGVVFAVSMAAQAVVAVSLLTPNLVLVGATGLLVFLLLPLAIAWLIASGLAIRRRAVFSLAVTVVSGGLLVAAAFIVLQPLSVEVQGESRPSDILMWDLPTGSRIAYSAHLAPEGTPLPPVVFVHGGPGWAVLEADRGFYSQITRFGYDVYLFDQAGSGYSEHLDSMQAYTVDRSIADLDDIREMIDADDMILIGHNAGAELAVRYMARFPERVARVVLVSPTPLTGDVSFFDEFNRTASPAGLLPPPLEVRPLLAGRLAAYGSDAAYSLVTPEAAGAWMENALAPGAFTCPGDAGQAPTIEGAGLNFYVHTRLQELLRRAGDPHPRLAENLTPALILYSECNYIAWPVIQQVDEALLGDTIVHFEDAGHFIYPARGEDMLAVIGAFLLEEPYPVEPYRGSSDPRPPSAGSE